MGFQGIGQGAVVGMFVQHDDLFVREIGRACFQANPKTPTMV